MVIRKLSLDELPNLFLDIHHCFFKKQKYISLITSRIKIFVITKIILVLKIYTLSKYSQNKFSRTNLNLNTF